MGNETSHGQSIQQHGEGQRSEQKQQKPAGDRENREEQLQAPKPRTGEPRAVGAAATWTIRATGGPEEPTGPGKAEFVTGKSEGRG